MNTLLISYHAQKTGRPTPTTPDTPLPPDIEDPPYFAGDPNAIEIPDEETSLSFTVGQEYEGKITWTEAKRYNVISGPVGITIGNQTGTIRWTPTPDQAGSSSLTINDGTSDRTFTLEVTDAAIAEDLEAVGWLAPHARKNGDGIYNASTKTFNYTNTFKAFRTDNSTNNYLSTVETIYLRGGIYVYGTDKNPYPTRINVEDPLPADTDTIPSMQIFAADGKTLVIRPWGNERVMLRGGVTGTMFRLRDTCKNIEFRDIELRGESNQKTYEDAVSEWWTSAEEFNGNGWAIAGRNIKFTGCVTHEVMSQAMACKSSTNVTIEDCIVANSARWTIAGTTGIGFVNMISSDDDPSVFSNKAVGCLIYGIESRLYSHVWSKRSVHLTLDEGEGTLSQPANAGSDSSDPYQGSTLWENCCLMWCGKGAVVNGMPKVTHRNCTLYNIGTTITGTSKLLRSNKSSGVVFESCLCQSIEGAGEQFGEGLSIGAPQEYEGGRKYNADTNFIFTVPSTGTWLDKNGTTIPNGQIAVLRYDATTTSPATFDETEALKVIYVDQWVDPTFTNNYAHTNDTDRKGYTGITYQDNVFATPAGNDPTPHADVPVGVGADAAHHLALLEKARSYSVNVEPDDWWQWLNTPDPDNANLTGFQQQTKWIMDNIPEGLVGDFSDWHDTLPYTDDQGEEHKEFYVPILNGAKTVNEVLGVNNLELAVVHPYPRPEPMVQAGTVTNLPNENTNDNHPLSSTAVTDAPIKDYQRQAFRLLSDGIHQDYGYAPSEQYLQLEANMIDSMLYLPYGAVGTTETHRQLFMNESVGFRVNLPSGKTLIEAFGWQQENVDPQDYYPTEWGTDTSTWTGAEHVRLIRILYRVLADYFNFVRYTTLTKEYVEQCFSASMTPRINNKPMPVMWNEGFGRYVWPPMLMALIGRNIAMTPSIFEHQGNDSSWNNSLGPVPPLSMANFDVTGLPVGFDTVEDLCENLQPGFQRELYFGFTRHIDGFPWFTYNDDTGRVEISTTWQGYFDAGDIPTDPLKEYRKNMWQKANLAAHEIIGHGCGGSHSRPANYEDAVVDAALHGYEGEFSDITYTFFGSGDFTPDWDDLVEYEQLALTLLGDPDWDFFGNYWTGLNPGETNVRYVHPHLEA